MPVNSFGLCGPTFQTRAGLWASERAVNWYPAIDESGNATSKVALLPVPGLQAFCDVPSASPPILGMWGGDNRLFAVSGQELFEISSSGSATKIGGSFSTGQTPVQFAASGKSLLIASGDIIYRVDGGTGTVSKVYDGAISVVWLDGYYIILLSDSNTIKISSPNDDGTVWDPLDQQTKMSSLDRVVRLEVHEAKLWLIGRQSIDIWYNSGDADFPFDRVSGAAFDQGTRAPFSVAKIDRKLYWLGSDQQGNGRVFRSEGYTPVRISNQAVEYLISTYLALGTDQLITGSGYEEDGHTFYQLSFPLAGATIVYDATTNLWHERARWNGTSWVHWRGASFQANVWGKHLAARIAAPPFIDTDARKIYQQSATFGADDGLPIRRLRVAPYVATNQQWLAHHYVRLLTDSTASFDMRYRFDDGSAWSNTRTVAPFRNEVHYRRLGRARDRLYEVSVSTTGNPPALIDAYLHAGQGELR